MTEQTRTPRFLRLPDVERMTSLRRAAIYQRMTEGTFPAARHISSRCSVWLESEICVWMDAQPKGVGPRPGRKAEPAASAA